MIGIHEPYLGKDILKGIKNCISSNWISSSGYYVKKLSLQLSKYLKTKYILPTNSGTSALDLAIRALNPPSGSIIIAPSITFVAPINAILYNQCYPLFIDCDNFLNICPRSLSFFFKEEVLIKKKNGKNYCFHKRTKKRIFAIIVTHVFGNAVNIFDIKKLCLKYNIKLIEDAAESFGTKYIKGAFKNKYTGTIGDIGCFSFNGNKIITAGNGGALSTNNKKYFIRAKHLAFQSKKDNLNFYHDEIGFNYGINNICASIAYNQLKNINKSLTKKKKIRDNYINFFKNDKNFSIMRSPSYSKNNNWLNILKISNISQINLKKIYKKFEKRKIQIRPVWMPNYLNKHLRKFYVYEKNNSDKYKNYICLPSSEFLTKEQIKNISHIFLKSKK